MTRISIDCGVDRNTGRNTCNDNNENKTDVRDKNDHRNGNDRPTRGSSSEKTNNQQNPKNTIDNNEELSPSDFYIEVNNTVKYDPLDYRVAKFFVDSGALSVEEARKIVLNENWEYKSQCIVNIMETNSDIPFTFENLYLINLSLKKVKVFRDVSLADLSSSTQAAMTVFSAVVEPLDTATQREIFKINSYSYSQKTRDIKLAQERYAKFMEGKRFKLSQKEREIMSHIIEKKEIYEAEKIISGLSRIAKRASVVGITLQGVELISSFLEANTTGNWNPFVAKVMSIGISTLTLTLLVVAFPTTTLLGGLFVAVSAVAISSVLGDEDAWNKAVNLFSGVDLLENKK